MARKSMVRNVCFDPAHPMFSQGESSAGITLEEAEALRLCDLEGFSQEQAARFMRVSRPTLQRVLSRARKVSAMAAVLGVKLEYLPGSSNINSRPCEERVCVYCRLK